MQNSFQIKSATVTDRGLNEKRTINEDSYLEMPEKGLFAVADGVGGAQAGEVASRMAVEILAEAFQNWHANIDAEDLMKAAIEKANEAVYQMAQELPALSTMATTIVALHINGNIATIGHVGDSRLYRLDPRGNLFRETQDHSILEEEIRAGRMTPAQAAQHPYRNVISRAVGAEKNVEVDMKTIMIEPNTTFLLCSDGITRHIEDYEIRKILLENPEPGKACEKFKQVCYKRGAEDNLTAVVVKVTASEIGQALEDEEKTISTVRESPGKSVEEIVGEKETIFATKELESEKAHPAEKRFAHAGMVSKVQVAIKPEEKKIDEKIKEETEESRAEIEKESFGSFTQRLFSAILLVILGVIVGVTLYHFILRNLLIPSEPKEILLPPVVVSQDIEYTSFEDNRRNVDANPEKYVQVSRAKAETTEDFYLLGRAYFLLGNYVEAKKAFSKAKELVAEAKEINRKAQGFIAKNSCNLFYKRNSRLIV
jgi:PPM family protein phosphatase